MVRCATCGSENDAEARFCSTCGTGLRPVCASCGVELPPAARFCPACGTPVEETVQVPVEERRVVSVLFADVTGSTTLGERMDPEQLRDVMATFFGGMREEIEAEGGTVEKFIGDAVMAAFGVPSAHEDDPARALRAAIRMRRRLEEVNTELDATHGLTLQMRIGVNTGEVLAAGDAPSGEPMVTGDVVNTAARLQTIAGPGEILAADRTRRAVRGFRFGERRDLALKGRSESVVASAVLGGSGEAADVGLSGPMVGRDAELGLLRSMYERSAAERRPHVVTIYGDPGVGKSRLTHEFIRWAASQERAPLVVRGRCLPYGDGITYWPLSEILRSIADVSDTDTPSVALDKIRSVGMTLLKSAPDPERATAAIAFTTGLEDPDTPLSEEEPKRVRDEMHAAWRTFFSALAADRPVVVVVEDIHWADPAMLDLLEELADRVEGGVSFVCPSRPDLTSTRPGWGGGKRNYSAIALDPLGTRDADTLVRSLLDVDGLPDSMFRQILDRAEGNPFFLEEIVRQLVDNRSVWLEGGRWRAAGDITQVEIPDTVQGVLAARIDLLDPPDRRVLQAAAVVGRIFWPGAVRQLLNGGGDRMPEALITLEERDLVRSRLSSALGDEPEYIFKHVLTRDVAYDTLPRRDRSAAHASIARWLEDTLGERAREFLELLSYHWFEAYRACSSTDPQEIEALRLQRVRPHAAGGAGDRTTLCLEEVRTPRGPGDRPRGDADRNDRSRTKPAPKRSSTTTTATRRGADSPLRPRRNSRPSRAMPSACPGCRPAPWRSRPDGPDRCAIAPPEPEVRRFLELGIDHLPPGDSRERVQLLGTKASWPFAFPTLDFSDEELDRIELDGLEAADMAIRLGDADLASAALDQATSPVPAPGPLRPCARDRGSPARAGSPAPRPGRDRGRVRDDGVVLGRGGTLVRRGPLRIRRRADRRGRHQLPRCTSWHGSPKGGIAPASGTRRSTRSPRSLGQLGERRDDPPYFVFSAFGSTALIHTFRGERAEADRLMDLLRARRGCRRRHLSPHLAVREPAPGGPRGRRRGVGALPAARPPAGGSRERVTSRRCANGCRSPTDGIERTTSSPRS